MDVMTFDPRIVERGGIHTPSEAQDIRYFIDILYLHMASREYTRAYMNVTQKEHNI